MRQKTFDVLTQAFVYKNRKTKKEKKKWWRKMMAIIVMYELLRGPKNKRKHVWTHSEERFYRDIVLFMPICVTILFCLSLNLHKAPLWKPQWRPRSIQVYRSTKASVYNPNRDLVVGAVDVSKVIQGPEGLGDSRAGDFVPGIHLFGLFFRAAPAFHTQVGEGV